LLIVRITRPTTVQIMDYIKEELKHFPSIILLIDYGNKGFNKITKFKNLANAERPIPPIPIKCTFN
jgi:hypothetical protein